MKVAIIGATGYAGIELVRLLLRHPEVQIMYLTSDSYTGQEIATVYPHLTDILQANMSPAVQDDAVAILAAIDIDTIANCADAVFISLPAGLSSKLVPQLLEKGLRVIDLGGDHRIPADLYETWYKKPAPAEEILQQAVYGLTEVCRQQVAGSTFVSNPGCYPTAVQLAILPALQARWVDDSKLIIVDAKSGVSGAGRGVGLGSHYSEVNENLKAYKIGAHQHTPEIEFHLSNVSGVNTVVSFTPHLIPMTRGILATSYLPLNDSAAELAIEQIYETYKGFYQASPFVRVRPIGNMPQTKEVYGTNYCDIGLHLDRRTNQLITVSVIDNLVKGAAGQAIQNLNVMYGLKETTGLEMSPLYP